VVRRFKIESQGRVWRIIACHTGDVVLPWRAWATDGREWFVADGQRLREAVAAVERKLADGSQRRRQNQQ
jgi:hypothetical protein